MQVAYMYNSGIKNFIRKVCDGRIYTLMRLVNPLQWCHNGIASQITSLTIVYSTVYSGADQRKQHNSASLAFVRGIHRWPVNSPHKWPVTWKMFPFDDIITLYSIRVPWWLLKSLNSITAPGPFNYEPDSDTRLATRQLKNPCSQWEKSYWKITYIVTTEFINLA